MVFKVTYERSTLVSPPSRWGGRILRMLGKPHWSVRSDDCRVGGRLDDFEFFDEFTLDDLRGLDARSGQMLCALAKRAFGAGLLPTVGINGKRFTLVLAIPAGNSIQTP